jgi:hypothetical protein
MRHVELNGSMGRGLAVGLLLACAGLFPLPGAPGAGKAYAQSSNEAASQSEPAEEASASGSAAGSETYPESVEATAGAEEAAATTAYGSTGSRAAAEPGPEETPAPRTVSGAMGSGVRMVFRPTSEGVALFLGSEDGSEPQRVCGEQCEFDIGEGRYRAALSQGARDPVEVDDIVVRTPAVVEGYYSSNATTRAAGAVILGVGLASAAGLIAMGIGYNEVGGTTDDVAGPTIVGGVVSGLLSLVIGIPMAMTGDDAVVHVRPMQ